MGVLGLAEDPNDRHSGRGFRAEGIPGGSRVVTPATIEATNGTSGCDGVVAPTIIAVDQQWRREAVVALGPFSGPRVDVPDSGGGRGRARDISKRLNGARHEIWTAG
jgi:hypothetical protein